MGPKIGPRWPQDRFKTILKGVCFRLRFCLRFWSVLSSILAYFGSHLGSILVPFWNISLPTRPSLLGPKRLLRPKGAQDVPKTAQDAPKTIQEAAQTLQEVPPNPQELQNTFQDPPKRPKIIPRCPPMVDFCCSNLIHLLATQICKISGHLSAVSGAVFGDCRL
jgi:hypothetical protein